jgi:hypothetical protein
MRERPSPGGQLFLSIPHQGGLARAASLVAADGMRHAGTMQRHGRRGTVSSHAAHRHPTWRERAFRARIGVSANSEIDRRGSIFYDL